MPDVTDREIEEQLKEALAKLEEQMRQNDDEGDLSLDPSPTIEDVKRAMYELRVIAAVTRQHAERLELHARHLDERLQPIEAEDIRELVRDEPEIAAQILHFARVVGTGPLLVADKVADDVGVIADRIGFFALSLQGRDTRTRSRA